MLFSCRLNLSSKFSLNGLNRIDIGFFKFFRVRYKKSGQAIETIIVTKLHNYRTIQRMKMSKTL